MRCDSRASSWPATLQAPFALVASPSLRLRQVALGSSTLMLFALMNFGSILVCDDATTKAPIEFQILIFFSILQVSMFVLPVMFQVMVYLHLHLHFQ